MKVSFLNVGQGDSLILQWKWNGSDRIGIIDCRNDKPVNSTIQYLEKINPERIDFIILSHPHSDHFSGLIELIGYLVKNNISIDHFYTTATLSPNRILMSIKGQIARNEVTNLFKLLYTLEKSNVLPTYFMNETGFDMPLNDKWFLKVLSPSIKEFNAYSTSANYDILSQEEEPENEPQGNLLSTFLAIYNNEAYFLLTSDSVSGTFYRIDKKYREFFNSRKLLLGQVAHHGSSKNFKSDFWKKKNPSKFSIPAVISVGRNRYDHPSSEVLEKLSDLGYEIHLTEALQNFKNISNDKKTLLDVFSKPKVSATSSNGLQFEFNNNISVKKQM